jgi:ABC-type nickel/cobalt efflux system permease component RcnA
MHSRITVNPRWSRVLDARRRMRSWCCKSAQWRYQHRYSLTSWLFLCLHNLYSQTPYTLLSSTTTASLSLSPLVHKRNNQAPCELLLLTTFTRTHMTHTNTHTHTHTHTHTDTHTHTHTHAHKYTHARTHTRTHWQRFKLGQGDFFTGACSGAFRWVLCVCVCVCVCTCVFVRVCVYVCFCVCERPPRRPS